LSLTPSYDLRLIFKKRRLNLTVHNPYPYSGGKTGGEETRGWGRGEEAKWGDREDVHTYRSTSEEPVLSNQGGGPKEAAGKEGGDGGCGGARHQVRVL